MFFNWLYFIICSNSFSFFNHILPLVLLFYLTDEVLSINQSANVFVFVDFNVHHKHWLIYSDGTDRPLELCHNFSFSNCLTQMVNFSTRVPNCPDHVWKS